MTTAGPMTNGECILQTSFDPDTWTERLVVVRADPRCRINADLLQEVSILTERGEDRYASLVGDVLTIHGSNRTVIYRVDYTDWDASDDSYGMEWPD